MTWIIRDLHYSDTIQPTEFLIKLENGLDCLELSGSIILRGLGTKSPTSPEGIRMHHFHHVTCVKDT